MIQWTSLNLTSTHNLVNPNILNKQMTLQNYPGNTMYEYDVTLTTQMVLDYLLSSKKGEIVGQNGREPEKGHLNPTWGSVESQMQVEGNH